MKRISVCLPLLIALSTYVNAQETPVAEWYGVVDSLYGYSSINADGDIFGPEIGRFDTGFAFAPVGGGIDVKLSDKFAFRLFQYDLISTNLGRGGGQLQSRISTGLVLRLGSR